MITYLSVCSGIEAATVAWKSLGFHATAFSEIEPFPCAVLAHHYPKVPNLGDMTKISGADYRGNVDILVGGTPCQSYSLAGRRLGLADERGLLTLKFVELANDINPAIVLWENVPGVLSSKDNAFGYFLAGLAGEAVPMEPPGGKWTDAGFLLGSQRTVAWRSIDAQYLQLGQRRKRLFVVASDPARADSREILFEFEGVRRDSPPRREKGQNSSCAPAGVVGAFSSKLPAGDALGNNLTPLPKWPATVASTLDTTYGTKMGLENQHINGGCPLFVPAKRGFNSHWNGGPHPTLSRNFSGTSNQELFHQGGSGLVSGIPAVFPVDMREVTRTESAHENLLGMGSQNAAAYTLTKSHSHGVAVCNDVAPTVTSSGAPFSKTGNSFVETEALVGMQDAVRRLTPVECERLQGFPDNYTLVPFRGKPASDTARYMAIGNSMAVNVMRWIGQRIQRELEKNETAN